MSCRVGGSQLPSQPQLTRGPWFGPGRDGVSGEVGAGRTSRDGRFFCKINRGWKVLWGRRWFAGVLRSDD